MKSKARKLRPPVKWHGGKSYLAQRIVACFTEHRIYVEPFVGGGSVLLNKPKSQHEIAGDLNRSLIEVWWSLQRGNEVPFIGALGELAYDQATFDEAEAWARSTFGPQRAVGFLVRNRFSRGGLGKAFAWSERLRGGKPGDENAWDTIRAELPAIAERVRGVNFRCVPALDLIREFDGPNTLIYLDPPYLHETRTAKAAYDHEMDARGHLLLLDVLLRGHATFLLSGYRSEMYDQHAVEGGWHRIEWDLPNHSGQGKAKQRRTEALWSNRPFPGSVPCREAAGKAVRS